VSATTLDAFKVNASAVQRNYALEPTLGNRKRADNRGSISLSLPRSRAAQHKIDKKIVEKIGFFAFFDCFFGLSHRPPRSQTTER
jgi:hypothetical protein